MELRFLPTSMTQPAISTNHIQDNHHQHMHIQNNNCEPSPVTEQHNRRNQANRPPPQPQPFNGTLINGLPTVQSIGSTTEIGIPQMTDLNNRIPTSLRRTPRRTPNGLPVPNSPRFMRSGINTDILHHNRSPIPSRVASAVSSSKRHRLGGRNNENISCGSLNSIEV